MAKAIIGSDIISKDLVKQLNELIKGLETSQKETEELNKEVAKGLKTQRELGELLKKSNENSKKLTETEKESIRVKQQIAKEITDINRLQTNEGKQIVELKQKKQALLNQLKDDLKNKGKEKETVKQLTVLEKERLKIKKQIEQQNAKSLVLQSQEAKNLEALKQKNQALLNQLKDDLKNKGKEKETVKQLTVLEKERLKIKKQIEQQNAKLLVSQSQEAKNLEALKQKTNEQNKANRENVKQNKLGIQTLSTIKGSYDQLKFALDKNNKAYRALTTEEQKNSAEGKKLVATIKAQKKALDDLDDGLKDPPKKFAALRSSVKSLVGAFGIVAGIQAFSRALKNAFQTIQRFDKAQSDLAAVLARSKDDIAALTADARKFGSTTAFSATQVSSLQTELAKLGFNPEEIQLSTKAVLNLAAATGVDLANAAKVTGSAIKAFNLSTAESERIASVLAVATTKTALSFQDYEQSLSTVAPVAAAFGFEVEDTIALFGQLKDAGFDASSAATATRNILLNLADSGGALAQELGGSVKSFDELIPSMQTLDAKGVSLAKTLALTDKRSVTAFNTFLKGADQALELRDSLVDVGDELDELVDTKMDNLSGDIAKMDSAYEGFILSVEQGNGIISRSARFITQMIGDLLTGLTQLDLAFKDFGDITEQEAASFYDATLSMSNEMSQVIKSTVDQLDAAQGLSDKRAAELLIRQLRRLNISEDKALALTKEFVKRRVQARELEAKANEAAIERQEQALLKFRAGEAEASDKQNAKNAAEHAKRLARIAELEQKTNDFLNNAVEKTQVSGAEIDDFINDSILSFNEFLIESTEENNDAMNELLKKRAEDEVRFAKEAEEKKKELRQEAFGQSVELANQLFMLSRTGTQQDLLDIQAKKDKELEAAKGNKEQTAAINKKFDKQEAEIKAKQAKSEKTQALFNIAINTAVGISKAVASAPFPANVPLIALAAAIGLAQAATVAAQPVPKFKDGVEGYEGGLAIVGDGGKQEVIVTPDNKMLLTPATDTLVNLPKGSDVIPSIDQAVNLYGGIEAEKLDALLIENKKLRKAIMSKPASETKITAGGFKFGQKSVNSHINYVNNFRL